MADKSVIKGFGSILSMHISFDGDNFETNASSKCNRAYTYGLANYRGSSMTTGSYWKSNCFVKTEIYNFESNRWNDAPDYPHSS